MRVCHVGDTGMKIIHVCLQSSLKIRVLRLILFHTALSQECGVVACLIWLLNHGYGVCSETLVTNDARKEKLCGLGASVGMCGSSGCPCRCP